MAVDASAAVPAGSVPSDFVGKGHFVAEQVHKLHAKAHASNQAKRDQNHAAGKR